MIKTEVHAVKGKIDIVIKNEKTTQMTLEPDEALEFGIMLLKAAYSVRNR